MPPDKLQQQAMRRVSLVLVLVPSCTGCGQAVLGWLQGRRVSKFRSAMQRDIDPRFGESVAPIGCVFIDYHIK